VLLYELLSGSHPFGPVPLKLKTADARDFLLVRQKEGPRPLRNRHRSIDPGLDALIARCLSNDPTKRPATAREMVAELRRLQAPLRRARRWVVAHAKAVAVASVLVGSGTTYGAVEVANMPSQATVHKQKAENLYRDGKYLEAALEFGESLEANPEQSDVKLAQRQAYGKLGETLYRDGKYNAAIRNFNLALHERSDPALHFARGRAYQKLGEDKLSFAIADYERANPQADGRVAACLGYCFSMAGVQNQAVKYNQAAIAAGYANAAVINNLSLCLSRSGDYAAAEAKATEALDLSPTSQAALYNRAMARFLQWHKTHEPAFAFEGLQDLRQVIKNGVTTRNAGFAAAAMCAAVLNDRLGDPKSDPLYKEGAAFLQMAVENGYSQECLRNCPDTLKCISEWADQLPADLKVEHRPNGMDDVLRLIDPVDD
jgi:tetratricopeptide (TPR) repeat protein